MVSFGYEAGMKGIKQIIKSMQVRGCNIKIEGYTDALLDRTYPGVNKCLK